MKRKKKTKVLRRFVGEYVKVRMMVIYIAILILFVAFVIRVLSLNLTKGNEYQRAILNQQNQIAKEIPFQRGEIYDRDMGVLARSQRIYRLILDRHQIHDDVSVETKDAQGNVTKGSKYIEPTVEAMVSFFGYTEEKAREILSENPTSYYEVINEEISEEQKTAFEAYISGEDLKDKELDPKVVEEEKAKRAKVKGLWFQTTYKRIYPNDSLASQIIGVTRGVDGTEGASGLENYYNTVLNGTNGREYDYMEGSEGVVHSTKQPVNGHKLVTTIDSTVQSVIEEEIAHFMEKNKNAFEKRAAAENVGIIVMNPQNGEILGMATSNTFNLNDPRNFDNWYSEEEQKKLKIDEMSAEEQTKLLAKKWNNFCLTYTYEPGSVIKPLTVAAALETGSIKPTDTYYCTGALEVATETIHCANRDGHGTETLNQAVANSCNVALMNIGEKTGVEHLLQYHDIFNFGQRTGVDLPGENSGIVFSQDRMGPVELATASFGQGFNITMIQGAAAFSSAINGGNYYRPHIVKQILDENDHVIENIEPVVVKKTISAETEKYVKESVEYMIENSVTGNLAKIEHYRVGGKTGTSETLTEDEKGVLGRDEKTYVCSFWAAVPMDKPQLLIYVVVDKPNAENQAAFYEQINIEKRIMSRLIPYYHLVGSDGKVYVDPATEAEEKKKTKKENQSENQNETTTDEASENNGQQPTDGQPNAEQPTDGQSNAEQPIDGQSNAEQPVDAQLYEEQPNDDQLNGEQPTDGQVYEEQPTDGQVYEELPTDTQVYEEQPIEQPIAPVE